MMKNKRARRINDEDENYSEQSEDDQINLNLAKEERNTRNKRIRTNILNSEFEEDNSIEPGKDIERQITWTTKLFRPNIHKFQCNHSGIKTSIGYSASALDFFQLFCSENFINFIVGTTNDYRGRADNDTNTINFRNTSLQEIYCFLVIKLLMSRNKKLSYYEYWSNNELLKSNIFGEVMSRDRFLYLLRVLHFNLNEVTADTDKLYKIREICDMLRQSFQNVFSLRYFNPFQNLCIDENLLLYKVED